MNIYIVDDQIESKFNKSLIRDLEYVLEHVVTTETSLENAFNHLTEKANIFRYDFVLIDEVFKNTNLHFLKKNITKGADLCRELTNVRCLTPLVLFTGTGNSANKIKEVLGDYGICYFFEKEEFKNDIDKNINKIISLPGYKRLLEIKYFSLVPKIKKYLETRTQNELFLIQSEADKKGNADWSNFEITIDSGSYIIRDLFCIYFEENIPLNISETISKFIEEVGQLAFFNPGFRIDCSFNIIKYFNLPQKEKLLVEEVIASKALNYYLNLLSVIESIEKTTGIIDYKKKLSKENRKLKPTLSCTHEKTDITQEESWERFINKLSLRRVLLLIYNKVSFIECLQFDEFILFLLFRDGCLKKYKKVEEKKEAPLSLIKAVLYKGLGLSKESLEKNAFILNEEREWLNDHHNSAEQIRSFLDDFTIENSDLNNSFIDSQLVLPFFYDIKDFVNRVTLVKNSSIVTQKEFNALLRLIKSCKERYDFTNDYFKEWYN